MISKNPQAKLKIINLSISSSVASGGGESDRDLTPNDDCIYKILSIYANMPVPAGGTAGTHDLKIYNPNIDSDHLLLHGQSAFNSTITFNMNYFSVATTPLPANTDEQQRNMLNMYCSGNYVLRFKYINNTDANQTGTRDLKVMVLELPERN